MEGERRRKGRVGLNCPTSKNPLKYALALYRKHNCCAMLCGLCRRAIAVCMSARSCIQSKRMRCSQTFFTICMVNPPFYIFFRHKKPYFHSTTMMMVMMMMMMMIGLCGKPEHKKLTSVQTVFRKTLHAIRHSNKKVDKVTLHALIVQIKKRTFLRH